MADNTKTIEELFAELQSKIQDCITWAKDHPEYTQTVEDFRTEFSDKMHYALGHNNIGDIKKFTSSVDNFMNEHKIQVSTLKPEVSNRDNGGRRRKSASSSSRPRRRSAKKRGTQRKPKRRQRRGSRRA